MNIQNNYRMEEPYDSITNAILSTKSDVLSIPQRSSLVIEYRGCHIKLLISFTSFDIHTRLKSFSDFWIYNSPESCFNVKFTKVTYEITNNDYNY